MTRTKVVCLIVVAATFLIASTTQTSEGTKIVAMEHRISVAEPKVKEVIARTETTIVETLVSLGVPKDATGSFKSYMDYRTITNPESKQWEMQQEAVTDEHGFRKYKDRYMVAVGTFYATECGKELNVTLSTGEVIPVVVSDIKQDRHTDKTNRYVTTNGNIVEFIVDTKLLDRLSRVMGDVSYSGLEGRIVDIGEVNYTTAYRIVREQSAPQQNDRLE